MLTTMYQCFNFLARNNGLIILRPDPDDPCKNRCIIQVGEGDKAVSACVEYDCKVPRDLTDLFIGKVCSALQEQVEK